MRNILQEDANFMNLVKQYEEEWLAFHAEEMIIYYLAVFFMLHEKVYYEDEKFRLEPFLFKNYTTINSFLDSQIRFGLMECDGFKYVHRDTFAGYRSAFLPYLKRHVSKKQLKKYEKIRYSPSFDFEHCFNYMEEIVGQKIRELGDLPLEETIKSATDYEKLAKHRQNKFSDVEID